MKEPNWLTHKLIFSIHEALLARFGGIEGIRDEGMLEAAVGRPQNLLAYGNPSIHDLAAHYAEGIVKNHPFLDGNKRTGFMAAYVFLGINGYQLSAPEEEAVLQTLALAGGELDAPGFSTWLSKNSEERTG